jgi:hypothetical protein
MLPRKKAFTFLEFNAGTQGTQEAWASKGFIKHLA